MAEDRKADAAPVGREALLKDALLQIRELRSRIERHERERSEPIAIVGIGCRFPGGADGPEMYWRLLAEGRNAVMEVPAERWPIDDYYDRDPDVPGKMATRYGAFLSGIDRFDAGFFGISPLEASAIDPQQRLLLEVCWESLENAGIAADRLMGSSAGIFIGIASSDYLLLRSHKDRPEDVDPYFALGTLHSVAAGRIAYVLGTQGPCVAVDTACSSSLVAVHLAVRSLRGGECRLALAGGVNVILAPEYYINFSMARMLAPDGRCKTFDATADGYVRGEGCGVLVLKRLSDALHDGDRIIGLIRGTSINQDGRSSGLTAPNGLAQEAVIRAALADGGIDPAAVAYVETHGTGTSLGDPIEVGALGAALCGERTRATPLRIGSVKTNVGHLEAAAGMAGLIKAVMSLERGTVPPQLHFVTPNPHIDWARWPIEVLTSAWPWAKGDRPRLAGVSSFGFSGTNAHVVVEEAPSPRERGAERFPAIVTVSGKSAEARRETAERLAAHLAANADLRLGDVAHTLNGGRRHHSHRASIVAGSRDELETSLRALSADRPDGWTRTGYAPAGEPPEVVFLFTGQGAQHPDMGRALYDSLEVFRTELDRCASILAGELEEPLLELLYGEAREAIYETRYAQPATFAFAYALAAQWRAWGVAPAAAMGHSLGEFCAACVGGALRLEDALRLVVARGRLMHALPRGAMAAVLAPEETVAAALAEVPGVSIASINSPDNIVISGDESEVASVCDRLSARGFRCKPIRVAQGAHSRMVEPMLDDLEEAARRIAMREPDLELVSNVTGEPFGKGQLNAAYWRRHARSQVRFADGLRGLYERGYRVFLEIGPRPTLTGFVSEVLPSPDVCAVASLRPGFDDSKEMLAGLGALYAHGAPIRWSEVERGSDCRTVCLPTYPFERERHWLSRHTGRAAAGASRDALFETCVRKTRLQSEQVPFDLSPASFPRKWAVLERLTLAYQTRALAEIGAFRNAGECHTPEDLCLSLGIPPTYVRLMRRWLEHLASEGMLESVGTVFRAVEPIPSPPLEPLLGDVAAEFGDYREFYDYVQSCGPRLAAVLKGAVSPLDTLFPEGSFDLADGLYHCSAVSRYLNGMVRATLEAAARETSSERPLRVLEIGAGTGGTTAALLPWLDGAATRYVFTDVSDLFLNRARERFAEYPFVEYARLDIDRDPGEQGFAGREFDVVVAANVLHATRDLEGTIARVGTLLGQGGLLVLSETTSHPRVFDITTGLIEGWQAFEDVVRGDNPLVSAQTWIDLLTGKGFRAAAAFPEPGSPAGTLGNHVIVATRPGLSFSSHAVSADIAPVPEDRAAAEGERSAECPATGGVSILEELRGAHPVERCERLAEMSRDLVMSILRLDEKRRPGLRDRLIELGFDSLMAVQLRNRLASALRLRTRLPATIVFEHPTCEALGAYLSDLLGSEENAARGEAGASVSARGAADSARPALPDDIDVLSETEAEARLLQRLDSLEVKK